ncbi:MAG: hypothetical protein QNK37_30695, partial [Acidobacteriota bacterium]|nr:hypothetical protein [Acidobacteriota bacterium]
KKVWFASGMLRFDILSRFEQDKTAQWDYATLALRTGRTFGRAELFFEGWHRYRRLDRTSIYSLGGTLPLARNWTVTLTAGGGDNHHYVPSLDSNKERQASLLFKWTPKREGFRRWLRGETQR